MSFFIKDKRGVKVSNQNNSAETLTTENSKLKAVIETENLKVQEAEWIEKEIQRQREIEDEIRERLSEEQKLLDEKKRSIEENMERTKQLKKYNEQRRQELNGQVYGIYGISDDRLEGIETYNSGRFKGCAIIMFLISMAMAVFTGLIYGFSSQLSLFLIAGLAVQGVLIPREGERSRLGNFICEVLYFVAFAAQAGIFVAFEAGFMQDYKQTLPYVAVGIIVLTVIGALSYFVYNPYAKFRSGIRQARKDLRRIEQTAEKTVRKNMKLRKKLEEKEERKRKKEQALEEKKIRKEVALASKSKNTEKVELKKTENTEDNTEEDKDKEKNKENSKEINKENNKNNTEEKITEKESEKELEKESEKESEKEIEEPSEKKSRFGRKSSKKTKDFPHVV